VVVGEKTYGTIFQFSCNKIFLRFGFQSNNQSINAGLETKNKKSRKDKGTTETETPKKTKKKKTKKKTKAFFSDGEDRRNVILIQN
jgi:hypothetical protein